MSFQRILIIGAGQIGESALLAALDKHRSAEFMVFDTSEGALKEARGVLLQHQDLPVDNVEFIENLGACANWSDTTGRHWGPDLVILATPVGAMGQATREVLKYCSDGTIITDVGSTKVRANVDIQTAIYASGRPIAYVPFHILNGNTGTGAATANKNLFDGKPGIIVPRNAPLVAEEKATAFWQSLGCVIHKMPARAHDKLLGTMSHLEHAIVFSLMKTGFVQDLLSQRGLTDHGNFLQAITRIAESTPTMWADIFDHNKGVVLAAGQGLIRALQGIDSNNVSDKIDELHEYLSAMQSPRIQQHSAVLDDTTMTPVAAFMSLLSLAIGMNVRETEEDANVLYPGYDLRVAALANPSLKDGVGIIAACPQVASAYLNNFWDAASNLRQQFLQSFAETMKLIEIGNRDRIMQLVEQCGHDRKLLATTFSSPSSPAAASVPVVRLG